MPSTLADMGRAGTLRSLSEAIRRRRDRKAGELAAEEAEKISKVRVPIGPAARPARAIEQPISMTEQPLASPTGETVTPPMDIAGEQEMARQQYEETNRAIEETKDMEVRNVEELPLVKSLEPYPSAKNRLMSLAEANGWVKMIGGVPTISNKQMQIAQGIISGDLKLRRELNELSLNDITQEVMGLKQAMSDPKLKEEEAAQYQAQLQDAMKRQNNILNAVNMMDREIQKGLALKKPAPTKEKKQPKTVTLEIGEDGKPTPGVTHIWTTDPETGLKSNYVGQAKTDRSGKATRGVKRTTADTKEANKSILQRILAGTDIEIREIFNDATGTVNEGLFRQKLRQAANEAEGEEKQDLIKRYKKYGKLKQLSQRNLRDTEMTIEDAVVQSFKDAGLEDLLGDYVTEKEGSLPDGATKGRELVEYAPGEKGYPVYDADGTLIGHDRVR